VATIPTCEREARLNELFAAGWTTELFAEFWAAPDLKRDGLVCENYAFFDSAQFQRLAGA
jgi:hypothetical protein